MTRTRRWLRRLTGVAFIVVVTLAVAPRLGTQTSTVGLGRVAVGFLPSGNGHTTLALPPLGSVSASTHPGPVQLRLELRSIDVAGLIDAEGRVDTPQLAADIGRDLPGAIRATIVRTLLIAAIVGAAAAAILPRRRWTTVLGGAGIGVVATSLLLASTLPDFDSGEFDELTFQGSLSSGSAMLASLTGGSESAVGQRLETLSDKLASLYSSALTADIDASAGETVILHISDLHLNPIGVELARRIATSFEVDAVLDTGDTTSFGNPFEGRFADLIADFPVPYLFVGGNHDSPENRAAISAASGVESIDRRVVEVGDVRILGFDDPLVTTTRHLDREERDRIERAGGEQLAELAAAEQPDVIAVHNPVILEDVVGEAPLAVAGHLHRFELGARDGTLIAVVGSTGATGLGSLLSETDQPYAAELLRFRGNQLVAIDRIEIVGTDGDLVVRRHSITDEDRDADDAGFIDTDVEEGTGVHEDESTTSSTTTTTTR